MADVTAAMVKTLRDATGAGMMDCKRALIESDGDVGEATEILREKGLASVAKRAGRSADQGLVDSVHPLQQHGWRPRRGELRDGLRREHRRVPSAREGPGAAYREPVRAAAG